MNNKIYTCSCCGHPRERHDLNGLLLIDGQWEDHQAYCKRVADCESQEAADVMNWVAGQLEVANV